MPLGVSEALRTAIADLLEHPAEALGRCARRQVEDRFSLEHYVHRLTPLVRSGPAMLVAAND